MDLQDKWVCKSTKDRLWGSNHYDTREEAIKVGKEKYPDEDFQVGQCTRLFVPPRLDIKTWIKKDGIRIHKGCFIVRDIGLIRAACEEMGRE